MFCDDSQLFNDLSHRETLMTGATKFYLSAFVLFVSGLSAATASAGLLAYEPFDYTAGEQLVGNSLNGGAGFDGAWRARQNNAANVPAGSTPVVAGSLAHPLFPGDLPTSGNSVLLTGEFGQSQPTRTFSALAKAQLAGAPGTTTWLSFLSQRQGPATDPATTNLPGNLYPRGVNVSLFDANPNIANEAELVGFGNSSNAVDNTTSIIVRGAGGSREGAYDPPGATPGGGPTNVGAAIFPWTDLQWIVARIDHSAGNDDVYLWINPDPKVEPLISDADAQILKTDTNGANLDYAGIGALRPFLGNTQNPTNPVTLRPYGVLAFDEFRIGTSYADMSSTTVVPEPASLVLMLLAGMACLARRK